MMFLELSHADVAKESVPEDSKRVSLVMIGVLIDKVMRSDSFTEAGRQRIIRKAVEILNASKIESAQKLAAKYKKDYLDKK